MWFRNTLKSYDLLGTKYEDNLVKIYFQLHIKCLQNRTLSINPCLQKKTYPKIKIKIKNFSVRFDISLKTTFKPFILFFNLSRLTGFFYLIFLFFFFFEFSFSLIPNLTYTRKKKKKGLIARTRHLCWD